jgi:hypothetical protein
MAAAKCLFACSLALAMALPALDASAQFGGGMRGGRGGSVGADRQRANKDPNPAARASTADQVEILLQELQEDLHLIPDQQGAWQSYADKVRAMASDVARERGRAQANAQLNSTQRIDHAVDVARNRLAALEDIAAAAKMLYAGLVPQQQTVADARLAAVVSAAAGEAPPAGAAQRTARQGEAQK